MSLRQLFKQILWLFAVCLIVSEKQSSAATAASALACGPAMAQTPRVNLVEDANRLLKDLTPGEKFGDSDPTAEFTRASIRFLAGRTELTFQEKALVYRHFVMRMTHNSRGMWKAQEYMSESGDLVFVGGKGYFVAIRAADGAVFKGLTRHQPSLAEVLNGKSSVFELDYDVALRVVDPSQYIGHLAGLRSEPNSRLYQIAIDAVAKLKGQTFEPGDYEKVERTLREFVLQSEYERARQLLRLLVTIPGLETIRTLIRQFDLGVIWQREILEELKPRKLSVEESWFLASELNPGAYTISLANQLLIIELVAKNKDGQVTDMLIRLGGPGRSALLRPLVLQLLESRNLDIVQKRQVSEIRSLIVN